MIDRHTLQDHELHVISPHTRTAELSVFYRAEGHIATLYIVDEKGSLFTARTPFINTKALLQPLLSFIRSAIERQSLEYAGLPTHFGVQAVSFFELLTDKKGLRAERCHVRTELRQIAFFNIQAIAEPGLDGELRFNIFCDQQEFMGLDLAEALYKAVASYVLSRRSKQERYPCYITDLDLSQCKSLLNPDGELQVSHYLKIKAQLENKLNRALLEL